MKKCYVEALGCVANRVDTKQAIGYLLNVGFEPVSIPTEADLILLMTCAFCKTLEDFSLNRLKVLNDKKKPGSQLVVGGCLPSIAEDYMLRSGVSVDFAFNPRNVERFGLLLNAEVENSERFLVEDNIGLVRISTGCSADCSYCAIKFAIGKTRSRSIESIIDDIDIYLGNGISKIQLVSEEVGAWGHDIGADISILMQKVLEMDDNIRLSLSAMNPRWYKAHLSLKDELVKNRRWDGPLYLPVQSGSDRILKLMRRGYVVADVETILKQQRMYAPWREITTDFIVGFPSETEDDFLQTQRLVEKWGFDTLNLFSYQGRKKIDSEKIDPKVSESNKMSRLTRLLLSWINEYLIIQKIDFETFLTRLNRGEISLPVNRNIDLVDLLTEEKQDKLNKTFYKWTMNDAGELNELSCTLASN